MKPTKKTKKLGRRFGGVAVAALLLDKRRETVSVERGEDGAPGVRKLCLVDLAYRQCHWPYNDPKRPGFYFCGADVEVDAEGMCGPYCEFHTEEAHRKG